MSHEIGGMGSEGFCVCIKCGYRKPHIPGVPCKDERCPNCGAVLLREGSEHHKQALEALKKRKDSKGGEE